MKVRTDFPRAIREIENTWIPMSDGARLAARIWLPVDADEQPVPAILEYIPYRKTDGTAPRDAPRHPYVAGFGYACVRVDMRGSGDSDGLLVDEYLVQEQDDAVEVLAWLAAQPWCTGDLGMIGISWGGFNSLQVAARRPPGLKAIVTLMSTDDRYADDVHYRGGCLLAWDMLPWATEMLAFNARPPDPRFVGERWREMWLDRLDKTPFIEHWMSHQRRDAYWRHGSVCEDFDAIEAAVYAIGGWSDGYTNAVFRMVEGMPGRCKGLVGPWSHAFPDDSTPGPSIGFGQECVRWWDHHLKGVENGVADEPSLRAWLEEPAPPRGQYEVREGRWVAEEGWPSPRIAERTLVLNDGTLDGQARGEPRWLDHRGAQTAGQDAGVWCGYGGIADSPPDQRREDALSLTWTSAPLTERVELLGFPEATLRLRSDRPQALVVVRLCEVLADGTSVLLSRGLLNLTHRESHEHPTPMPVGEDVEVRVGLDSLGRAVEAGSRLRVAVSSTYWPWAWPSPEPVTLSVRTGLSTLALPVRPRRDEDADLRPFEEPEGAAPLAVESIRPAVDGRFLTVDVARGVNEQVFEWDVGGLFRLPDIDLDGEDTARTTFRIVEGDPLSASCRVDATTMMRRGDWSTRAEIVSTMSADREAWHLTTQLDAYEGDVRVFAKAWAKTIPRDHV